MGKILKHYNDYTQQNVICVDSEWILNYIDNEPACIKNVPEAFYLENNIELETHR